MNNSNLSYSLKIFYLPYLLLFSVISTLLTCKSNTKEEITSDKITIQNKVDNLAQELKNAITDLNYIIQIDHSRLAQAEGVYTPPAIVTIFSNASVNSKLIGMNPLIGLDLPYKALCYSEPDTSKVSFIFTSGEFLQKRHGLTTNDLKEFNNDMYRLSKGFPEEQMKQINLEIVERNHGIIQLNSAYDFDTTVQRLKNVVNSQDDTKWFGEIDFKEDARNMNVLLPNSTLLLFGGPAPGGNAMFNSPKLGLDAFCQKLLVYEKENNQVVVAFNDITYFADLYYNRVTKPQEIVNQRLLNVFTTAISN